MCFRNLFLILLLMFSFFEGKAQISPDRGGKENRNEGFNRDRDTSKVNEVLKEIIGNHDSLSVSVYYADKPEKLYLYPDTMLGYYFQQSDPARQQVVDYINLGSMGTPSRPLLFTIPERQGMHLGFRQFDLYRREVEDIRYFKTNRTFTETYYAQNHTKDDFIFKGSFSRDLNPNWNISIDYDRISHLGIFTNQKSRHTAFTVNAAHKNKKGNYSAYMSYSLNDMQQGDNGGIESEADFNNTLYSDRNNIPVYSSIAKTRMQEQIFAYTHYLNLLAGKKDSVSTVANNQRQLTLGHQFVYTPGEYKYYDTNPDTLFYGNLQIDDRGLRQFLSWDKIRNTVKLSTFKSGKEQKNPKDLYTVGLIHTFQKTNQEPVDTTVNNLFLFGEWDYNPAPFLELNAYAHYGIGSNSNEYLVKGDLKLDFGKIGIVEGAIMNQRFSADLIQDRIFISKREVYNNDFVKPITTSISGSYHLPASKTTASFHYHLLNNHIYYDTLALARQSSETISVLGLVLQQDFRFGAFGLDNTITFQADNSDILRLPGISMKNSIYLEGNVFKRVMFARLGFDFRMNTSYYSDAYQPVTGQFHLQDDRSLSVYPAVDFFLSFKVQTFRGFFKMENITSWFTNDIYYLTPNHPFAEAHFRFGVSWRFID